MTTRDKSPPRRGALGKGLSSLLGDADSHDKMPARESEGEATASSKMNIVRLKPEDIEPNPQQPRKVFNEQALQELSSSLKQDGVLQPIIVAKGETDGKFVIIAGERRWRASRMAGLDTIPAIVKGGVTEEMLRLALIENIQRADLNIIEEAEAYASLIKDYGLTQEQCADKVGKDRTSVTNALRLLSLPREIQDDIMENRLSMGHGRALLSLEDKKLMLRARDIVIKKKLSVRQTEQLCKGFKGGNTTLGKKKEDDADLQYVAESLRSHLHTKVKMIGSSHRGKIEISYFSAAELERILKLMGHDF